MNEPASLPVERQDDSVVPAPARVSFTTDSLPDEPAGDLKLVLESGMQVRERLTIVDPRTDGVKTTAADPASVAFTVVVSLALLDDAGNVATQDGRPVIAPAHEISLTNEALGRLGTQEAVDAAILDAREVAAARAELVFKGALLAKGMLAGRG